MNIEIRLDQLKKDLLSSGGPAISTNRNYPFAIFHYPPHEEFAMRQRLKSTIEDLRSKGWRILNVDLLAVLLDFLNELEGGDAIPAWIQEELDSYTLAKQNFEEAIKPLHNQLSNIFRNQDNYPAQVLKQIHEVSAGCDPLKTVIFLSRIGALYPFYRTSSLLRFLDNGVKVPVIILYPGIHKDQHYLSFMGELDADRDYRPRIY